MTGLPEQVNSILPVDIKSILESNNIRKFNTLAEAYLNNVSFVDSVGIAKSIDVYTADQKFTYDINDLPVSCKKTQKIVSQTAHQWYRLALPLIKENTDIKYPWEVIDLAWNAATDNLKNEHIANVRRLTQQVWEWHQRNEKVKKSLSKSITPFQLNGIAPVATGFPAAGLANALLAAGKGGKDGWILPNDSDCPQYVHQSYGDYFDGKMLYYIIQPKADDENMPSMVQKELALEILKSMGSDTVWLHMLLLAYAARSEIVNGGSSVINKETIWEILDLNRKYTISDGVRRSLTNYEKNEKAFAEIKKLKSIGLQMAQVIFKSVQRKKGQTITKFEFDRTGDVSPFWDLNIHFFGQGENIQIDATGVSKTKIVYEDWQLVSRTGQWGNIFLYGEPKRHFGYLPIETLTKIDRNRSPWSASLAINLIFKIKMADTWGAPVYMKNSEIISRAGGNLVPIDKETIRIQRDKAMKAINEQRNWGCIANFDEWPDYLKPTKYRDLDVIDNADGSAACPACRMPRNYWDQFLNCKTRFDISAGMKSAYSQNEKSLLPKKQKTWKGDEIRELRSKLKFTQQQLAQAIGISQLHHYEAGRRNITQEAMKSLDKLQKTLIEDQ